MVKRQRRKKTTHLSNKHKLPGVPNNLRSFCFIFDVHGNNFNGFLCVGDGSNSFLFSCKSF